MTNNNTGQTAIITGATRGLGAALARALADRGWNLIITARHADRLRSIRDELAQVTHVAGLAGDITDPEHRDALAVLARGHAGVDAVINNAGALGPSPLPPILDFPLDALRDVLETNVVAQVGLLQSVRPWLKERARIVNVTSDAAVNPYTGWAGTARAKPHSNNSPR